MFILEYIIQVKVFIVLFYVICLFYYKGTVYTSKHQRVGKDPLSEATWVSIFLLLTYFRGKSVRFKGSANIIKNLQNGNTINRFVATNQAAIAGKLSSKQCCDGLIERQHRHSIDFLCYDVLIECDHRHSIGFNNMNTTSLIYTA